MINLIVATDTHRGIGRAGDLPWRLPSDLRFFKRTTMGHPIIMGRRTYESIGRALPGRTNIVVTRQPDFSAPKCLVTDSPEAAIERAQALDDEVMVIGGAAIYAATLPRVERIYLTVVHGQFGADTFFPALEPGAWTVIAADARPADERNPHDHTFYVLARDAAGLPSSLSFMTT